MLLNVYYRPRIQEKLITDAIKDLKQEHISFYRWMIGTLISLLAIAGLYLYPKMNR
uniref:Uncharacterized protein n=1 Tax=Candidatus Kentrum eta TaxID=2126337 RepID=A0A450VCE1_9GAMM|nr:MAG: hypothetical protein BECKH772B_GA0070898_102822 [Candidatus Kentron sp. H]